MPKVDFGAQRKQAEEQGLLGGGGFFKFQEGDNRMRLMSVCLPHTSEFQGRKNFKWLCYVLDRRDGEVKAFFMPHRVYKAIEALQMDPEYSFTEVPMPYDINVKAKGAGTKEVEYTLLPARRATELSEDELEKLEAAKPLEEVKAAIAEKQAKKAPEPPHPAVSSELTDEEIPF